MNKINNDNNKKNKRGDRCGTTWSWSHMHMAAMYKAIKQKKRSYSEFLHHEQ